MNGKPWACLRRWYQGGRIVRFRRSAWVMAAVAAAIIGWAAYASRGADPANSPSDRPGSDWLAQADPQDDRPPPPPEPGRVPHGPGGPWMNGKMPKEMQPMLEAGARARVMKEYLGLADDIGRVVSNPLHATIVAVHGITELGKDNPKQAAEALHSLLDQEQSVAGRTVIHLGLKDIHEKAHEQQAALDQLVAIIKENAQPLKDFEQQRHERMERMDRMGRMEPSAPARERMERPGSPAEREGRPPRGPRPPEPPPPGQ